MGNHEFCVTCGENINHDYGECNPIKVAEKKLKEVESLLANAKRIVRAKEVLKEHGVEFSEDIEKDGFRWLRIF